MLLQGSCHCGKIKFSVESDYFYPYQRCYCSICRKTQGGGGYAINLSAQSGTLKVRGKKFLSVYRARVKNPGEKTYLSSGERYFCSVCSSGLWLFDKTWPDLIHPFASAIDTPLPRPPESTHLMLDFRPSWVEIQKKKKDKMFKRYSKESIADWHDRVVN